MERVIAIDPEPSAPLTVGDVIQPAIHSINIGHKNEQVDHQRNNKNIRNVFSNKHILIDETMI